MTAPARLDLPSAALNLARAAADKRRPRRVPLSRSEALREAPWVPDMAASGVDQHAFRAAYADRLEERGLALPRARSGPSGAGGKPLHPAVTITGVPPHELAAWDRTAKREGLPRSVWARRELLRASGRKALR